MSPFIIIFIIIDIYINIILCQNNKKLRNEVREIKNWCIDELSKIIEEEEITDQELDKFISRIEYNKITQDINEIMYFDGKCPYHEKVFEDYQVYRDEIVSDINEIKNRKSNLIKDIKINIEKEKEKIEKDKV